MLEVPQTSAHLPESLVHVRDGLPPYVGIFREKGGMDIYNG
jgi:hypothetical protein